MATKPNITLLAANAKYTTTTFNKNFKALADAIVNCLGRGGMSESPNGMDGDLDMDNNRIRNVATPIGDSDAVNKAYVDALVILSPGTGGGNTGGGNSSAIIGEASSAEQEALLFAAGYKIIIRTDLLTPGTPPTSTNPPPTSSITMVLPNTTTISNTPPTSQIVMKL